MSKLQKQNIPYFSCNFAADSVCESLAELSVMAIDAPIPLPSRALYEPLSSGIFAEHGDSLR
jgi:predicted nuclease with RNAse H fold